MCARFGLSHIDRAPLGDMASTVGRLIQCSPQIDFVYTVRTPDGEFVADTRQLRGDFGGDVPLSEPAVAQWVREYIDETHVNFTKEQFDMKSLQELAAIRDRMKQAVNTVRRPTTPPAWWWAWPPAALPPGHAGSECLYRRDRTPRAVERSGHPDRLHRSVPVRAHRGSDHAGCGQSYICENDPERCPAWWPSI